MKGEGEGGGRGKGVGEGWGNLVNLATLLVYLP